MDTDDLERAGIGSKVSRRWLLRSTANLTAGLMAVGAGSVAAAEATPVKTVATPDHDPASGEIFDRERHHHWDTV